MCGFVICPGGCDAGKQVFSFNPADVPSLTIDGGRRAFRRECIERANVSRKEKRMPPLEIHPRAYQPLAREEMP